MYLLEKIFKPEIFQGGHRKKKYFEGWYFKLTDKQMSNSVALIPGVAYGTVPADRHSFVQVLDAKECKTFYVRYDISDFKYNPHRFEIIIGNNYFSDSEIRLDMSNDQPKMRGRLVFKNIVPFPRSILRPGVMGPFSYIPFMECHHGVVNIHHEITGELNISDRIVDFSNGYGYIEKDWGSSFPEAWIWLQSNHFGDDDVTLMFSVAKIPWLGRSFIGFISFIRIKQQIIFFTTYNRAKIVSLKYDKNNLVVLLQGKTHQMQIEARHSETGILKAPKRGLMQDEISESITAELQVILYDNNRKLLYMGNGTQAGMEIYNEIINTDFDS